MPAPNKYGKALNALKKKTSEPAASAQYPVQDLPALPAPEQIGKAGREGKRSNPEYAPRTFFVRKNTKRQAVRLLEDTNADQDLSDLVEQLLTKWIAEHSHV